MHYVDRGPEPSTLRRFQEKYTQRWVTYYRAKNGKKPSDSYWRNFIDQLSTVFLNLCGYCEQECRGEVDHFRPKSQVPEKVYDWHNWIFACHDCNHAKVDKWPIGGYVDPCAVIRSSHPERYFDFDFKTGLIIAKKN